MLIGGAAALILFILFIAFFRSKRSINDERAQVDVDTEEQMGGILALQQRDPAFSVPLFLERVKTIMAKVNEAWIQGSMGPARRLISDGVYIRFQTQLNLLRSQGIKNIMVDWHVLSAEMLSAESDTNWDTIHVKVVGEARDADVAIQLQDEAATQQARKAPLKAYQEIWSFIRRRGKLSKNGVPAAEGQCPSCGATLPLSNTVRCDHCQAIVNSGEHDFVLAEITQPEEWSPYGSTQMIPGLAELQERDSLVSRQELEDRASVIFWKWIEATCTGNKQKLARFCLDSLDTVTTQEKLQIDQKLQLSQIAVGSSEVIYVVPHGEDPLDRVWVEIRWSASVQSSEPQPFHHVLTLARSGQVQSKRGLSSLDCPVCGGPLAESDVVTCDYCGETLSGGKHEWALAEIRN